MVAANASSGLLPASNDDTLLSDGSPLGPDEQNTALSGSGSGARDVMTNPALHVEFEGIAHGVREPDDVFG